MSKQWCCRANTHPNDWYCTHIWARPQCPIHPLPPSPPLALHVHALGGASGIGETKDNTTERLMSLEKLVNETLNGPTSSDLIKLATELQNEEFIADALRVAQYLEGTTVDCLTTLAASYRIQTECLEKLDNSEAVGIAQQISQRLDELAVLRIKLSRCVIG